MTSKYGPVATVRSPSPHELVSSMGRVSLGSHAQPPKRVPPTPPSRTALSVHHAAAPIVAAAAAPVISPVAVRASFAQVTPVATKAPSQPSDLMATLHQAIQKVLDAIQKIFPLDASQKKTVEDFFITQRKIGLQWPKALYPMKYDISIYRRLDAGCYSSVDSDDWRKREISIRATDALIDLIDEVVRKPIVEATRQSCVGVTPKNMKEKWANHYVNTSFHISDVPDFPRINPADTRCEHTRFKMNAASKGVLVAVPKKDLEEIAQKVKSFWTEEAKELCGAIFRSDFIARLENLFKMMKPENACLNSVMSAEDKMFSCFANEAGKRVIRAGGMNPRLVDSMVEPFLLLEKIEKGCDRIAIKMIVNGFTEENLGMMTR